MVAARLVAALVAGLLVCGCSEEPEPRFEDPTASPSGSASTPTPEAEPWEVKSRAGAEAFARHWVETFNEAQSSGATSELTELSARECKSCRGIINRISTVADAGGTFRGAGWRLLDATPNPLEGSRTSVALNVRRSAQSVREREGATAQSYPASKGIYRADLVWKAGAWRMDELVDFE